jgi:hypothetical protein
MGVTKWYFLRHPDGSFRSLPWAHFSRFYERCGKLPDWVSNEALFVEMAVELENRQPVGALKTGFSRFKIDSNGLWDERHKSSALADAMRMMSNHRMDLFSSESAPIDSLVEDIHIHLSRCWEPSDQDLQALCAVVNKRAKCTLLTPSSKVLHQPKRGDPAS